MADPIHDLYAARDYPAMSHPLSDPAVTAVAARLAGLETPHPRRARILEIGCSSGHNLLPLALRWPETHFTGIDLAARAIATASARAAAAGLCNVVFHAADLRAFEADGPFDFIIAHGVFSWVPDEVKTALLRFCRGNLSPSGIATVSFNLAAGWQPRLPVIAKVRAIQRAGGADEMAALAILKTLCASGDPEAAIVADMLEKGPSILPFDDFAPVNDPWPLDRFAQAAANAGLRWLGESDPGANVPPTLPGPEVEALKRDAPDPLAFQMAVDEAARRKFRSGLLCRDDAPVADRVPLGAVFGFSIAIGRDAPDDPLHRALRALAPACVPAAEIALPVMDRRALAGELLAAILGGSIRPRIEPLKYAAEPPDFPRLDAFRALCARDHLPLVDAWHKPCAFPAPHYQVLGAMDGTRGVRALAAIAGTRCPELDFGPWLRHLAWRGMFA